MTDVGEMGEGSSKETERKKAKNNEDLKKKNGEEEGNDGETAVCDGSLGSVIRNTSKNLDEQKLRIKAIKELKMAAVAKSANPNTNPEHESANTKQKHDAKQAGGKNVASLGAIEEAEDENQNTILKGRLEYSLNNDDDTAKTEEEKLKEKKNDDEAEFVYEKVFEGGLARGHANLDPEIWAEKRKDADRNVLVEEMNADASLHVHVSAEMFAKKMEEINTDLEGDAKKYRIGSRDFGCALKLGTIAYIQEWIEMNDVKMFFEDDNDMNLDTSLSKIDKKYLKQLYKRTKSAMKDVWCYRDYYARTTGPLRIIENCNGFWNEKAECAKEEVTWSEVWAIKKIWWNLASITSDNKSICRLIKMTSQLNYFFEKTCNNKKELELHRKNINFHAENPQIALNWERIKRSAITKAIWQQGIKVDEHIRERNKMIHNEKRASLTEWFENGGKNDAQAGKMKGKGKGGGGKKGKGGKTMNTWSDLIAKQTEKLISSEGESGKMPKETVEEAKTLQSKAPSGRRGWWTSADWNDTNWQKKTPK